MGAKVDEYKPNTWYFCIVKSSHSDNILPWYIDLFLDSDGLTHVMCFTHIGDNQTIIYNYLYSGLVTHLVDEHADIVAAKFKRAGYDKVVKLIYNKQIRNISHSLSNTVPGCVTFAKILLGSKDWIFTPLQFYNWLLSKGGIELSMKDADAIITQELIQPNG